MKVSALLPAFLNAEEPVADYSGFKVSSWRKEIRAHLIVYNLYHMGRSEIVTQNKSYLRLSELIG